MKPNDYIKKYNIQKGWESKYQKQFLSDLTSELLALLEYNKAQDNIVGFNNAVKIIRMKWDAISAKICYGLPEAMWNYFFATVISKIREECCPKDVARMERLRAERHAERMRRKQIRETEERFWREQFRESIFERYAMLLMMLSSCPTESFEFLGLPTTATEEDIKNVYRNKVKDCHPDKGGSQEEFVRLTDHKNKCLKWATK